jgi:hypothetical protein
MRRALQILILTLVALVVTTTTASAASEYGSTSRWPWSGYWWPMLDTSLNLYDNGQAMDMYDRYMRATGRSSNAQAYEKANFSTSDPKNDWWGHCHAWSAASIMTRQPPSSVTRAGVTFGTDQLRGLVTKLYNSPTYTWLAGTRNDGTSTTTAAYKDVAPAWMDWLLRYYVRYYRYPFIMDINADNQVWNFPVFAYSRTSTTSTDGTEAVRTTVWYSSPDAHITGTKYFSRTYTYNLKSGTLGSWTGNSVSDHPDFAWIPTGKNPPSHISESVIEEIIGGGYNA